MTPHSQIHKFMAFYMLIFLVACGVMALATFVFKHGEFELEDVTTTRVLKGKVAANIEKEFEDNLFIRDAAVGLWGAINYGLFHSGKDKVVIGEDGWLFTSEEFEVLKSSENNEQRFLSLVKRIHGHLKDHDIELVVVLLPAKSRLYSEYLGRASVPQYRQALYERVRGRLLAQNIFVPDVYTHLREKKSAQQLFLKLDTHWTPEGAQIVADYVAQAVSERSISLEGTDFTTDKKDTVELAGDLEKFIPTGIFKPFLGPEAETISVFETQKQSDGLGLGGLFGEEVIPVTLIGTSYSAIDKWNFDGALKTALQADVLNRALEGKGPLAPMAEFLTDTDLTKSTTKLVIWEIPERFVPVAYDDVQFPKFIEESK